MLRLDNPAFVRVDHPVVDGRFTVAATAAAVAELGVELLQHLGRDPAYRQVSEYRVEVRPGIEASTDSDLVALSTLADTSGFSSGLPRHVMRVAGTDGDSRSDQTRPMQRFRWSRLVETRGIEPLTPALQRRCSAN
jgi:hypothetical protein